MSSFPTNIVITYVTALLSVTFIVLTTSQRSFTCVNKWPSLRNVHWISLSSVTRENGNVLDWYAKINNKFSKNFDDRPHRRGRRIFHGEKLMWHQPVGSNAVGCSSCADAVIDFLLRTPHHQLTQLINGPGQPPKTAPFPWGIWTPSNTYGSPPPSQPSQLTSWHLTISVMRPKNNNALKKLKVLVDQLEFYGAFNTV